MVIYFNKTDLVNFGKYLLSEERKQLIENHPELAKTVDERLKDVSHADIENFLLLNRKN